MSTTKIKVSNIASVTGTGNVVLSASPTLTGTTNTANLAYTGTLTGSTSILNIGSGQVYKDASGNVGIGTSSPAAKLHVYGGAGTSIAIQSSAAAGNQWRIGDAVGASDGTLVTYDYTNSQHVWDYKSGAAGYHSWYTAGTERMRIDSSGNVGIGTSSPNNKLTVGAPNSNGGSNCVASFSGANVANLNTSGMVVITPTDSIAADIGGSIGFAANGTIMYPTGTIAGRRENATANNYASYMQFSTCNSIGTIVEKMRIDSSGRLYINQSGQLGNTLQRVGIQYAASTEWGLNITNSTTSTGNAVNFTNSSGTQVGQIQCSTSVTSYVTSSDQRLKENIVDAPSALNSVNAIKVRSFDWKSDGTHVDYGYIAQELLEVAPEAVAVPENEDEMMGVDFGKLTPRLVKAIQELKAIIDTQQEQINSLLGK